VFQEDFSTPTDFRLSQNFPNPFNNGTMITYSLARNAQVKLTVFNVLGQDVETLVNSFQTAGKYSVQLNADNWTSGIYFYQIEAGDFNETRRMLLLK
jgi:hypothetical protein